MSHMNWRSCLPCPQSCLSFMWILFSDCITLSCSLPCCSSSSRFLNNYVTLKVKSITERKSHWQKFSYNVTCTQCENGCRINISLFKTSLHTLYIAWRNVFFWILYRRMRLVSVTDKYWKLHFLEWKNTLFCPQI